MRYRIKEEKLPNGSVFYPQHKTIQIVGYSAIEKWEYYENIYGRANFENLELANRFLDKVVLDKSGYEETFHEYKGDTNG